MFVEKPIPNLRGYFARTDGTIRTPYGSVLRGHVGNKHDHLRITATLPDGSYKPMWVHRLIARTFVKNPRPDIFWVVDHINQDTQDNRPENLRWITTQLNCLNNSAYGASFVKTSYNSKTKTFYPVCKWRAYVTVSKKSNHLGLYKTFREAYLVSKQFREDAWSRIYDEHIAQKRDEAPRAGRYILGC